MQRLATGLMVLVALLLVVLIIDRNHKDDQIRALNESIRDLDRTLREPKAPREVADLSQAVARIEQRLQSGVVPTPTGTGPATTAPVDDPAARDGNPKLGVNFLKSYDRSWYHPEWQGGTLRGFWTTPKGLNPLLDNSTITSRVHARCNDSLCDRSPQTPEQWSESLATSVIIADDYRTYTFRIRPGVMWTRPTIARDREFAWLDRDVELTADDFVFTARLIMDPTVDCPQIRNYWEDFDRAEVVDRYTLRLRWKKKVYTSLSQSLGLSPMPRHIYARNADGSEIPEDRLGIAFNKHWFDERRGVVGVGAYILSEFQPDARLVLTRNPAYWGVPYHFDRLEYNLAIKKDDAQLVAFKNGQVQRWALPPLKYKSEILDRNEPRFAALDPSDPKAGRRGEFAWERVKDQAFYYIGWNLRRPPFDDRRVRQAMSHAFPKERIIRDVFFGLGVPVQSDVHPDSQYCNHDLKPYVFDLQRAKALLAEAGWTDSDGDGLLDKQIDGRRQPFRFEIVYYQDSPEWDNTLAIYRNELRAIGIDMKPTTLEFKELLRRHEDKDFSATVGGWGMDWDIDYFQLWHSSQADVQGSSNSIGFKNARVDELATKLRETFEVPERIAIAKEIQAILHEEQPYTFFRAPESIFVWQNRPPPGGAVTEERYLDGVAETLDLLHPLENRTPLLWHFRR